MSYIGNNKSTTLPLNRVFDKFGDIITQQWNESQKIMKVPHNPPVVWSRPHVAQDSDNSEALNSNMNSKSDFIFISLNNLHRF